MLLAHNFLRIPNMPLDFSLRCTELRKIVSQKGRNQLFAIYYKYLFLSGH